MRTSRATSPQPETQKRTSATAEDYLERIHALLGEKGYARIIDIAARMRVSGPSVTRMVQRLAKDGLVEYERYRGVVLTESGSALGKAVTARHRSLEALLQLVGVTDARTIWRDVEGIEHHVSPVTMKGIRGLVQFFEERPAARRMLAEFRRGRVARP